MHDSFSNNCLANINHPALHVHILLCMSTSCISLLHSTTIHMKKMKKIPASLILQVETGEDVYCDDVPVTTLADDAPVCSTPPPASQQSVTSNNKKITANSGAIPVQQAPTSMSAIPAHALAAFALFLRLPGYAEVLLIDRLPAQCLLRLMLGATDDGEGSKLMNFEIECSENHSTSLNQLCLKFIILLIDTVYTIINLINLLNL